MFEPVGIRSLAVSFPSIRRTNDYYRENYPELLAQAEHKGLAQLFSLSGSTPENEFEQEMMPYLSDPFRGSVERWVLGQGESSLTLEYRAACDALDAAKLSPQEIDLMIVASVWPEQIIFGNASCLARQLGLQGAAWNINGGTGSTPVALQTACALVQAGEYRNVLVVISCTYSHFFDEADTTPWFISDGAGAFVVSSLETNQGILGTKTVHTGAVDATCSAKFVKDIQGYPQVRMQLSEDANKLISETSAKFLRNCCEGVTTAAGVTLKQIDFFIFHTFTAWFTNFGASILGIDPERTINLYPWYANVGPVLTVVNLYYAARLGKIRENDLVLLYGMGGAGTASANVMRWGKVALGPDPLKQYNLRER
ncbi:MAG: 3-oxoacyl-ACP synthase [Symploca sp. SIO2E9]|nr:3-oxoacyl-ACP synthase [Symploca sp. SIO2E9]